MTSYTLQRYSVPADLEEPFTAELWSLGVLGIEIHDEAADRRRLDAYFPHPPPAAARRHRLGAWRSRGVEPLGSRTLEDRDWLASYRATAEPFDVGRTLRVDPRDPDGESTPDPDVEDGSRATLRIPAQTAFGTGSHESTRLVLEWLEDLDLNGLAVLDVGTGSGILSFAAERLGAARVVGFDVDAPSVCIAGVNARLNDASPLLFAGGLAALRPTPRFDLTLVNILPEKIAADVPRLAGMLKPRGRLISSGNLAERRDELLARWRGAGFSLEAERGAAEWLAFLLRLSGD